MKKNKPEAPQGVYAAINSIKDLGALKYYAVIDDGEVSLFCSNLEDAHEEAVNAFKSEGEDVHYVIVYAAIALYKRGGIERIG